MSNDWYKKGARAVDDDMKRELMARVLIIWQANPELRFMQLLGNVFRKDAYYIEDYDAVKAVEDFYNRPIPDYFLQTP